MSKGRKEGSGKKIKTLLEPFSPFSLSLSFLSLLIFLSLTRAPIWAAAPPTPPAPSLPRGPARAAPRRRRGSSENWRRQTWGSLTCSTRSSSSAAGGPGTRGCSGKEGFVCEGVCERSFSLSSLSLSVEKEREERARRLKEGRSPHRRRLAMLFSLSFAQLFFSSSSPSSQHQGHGRPGRHQADQEAAA